MEPLEPVEMTSLTEQVADQVRRYTYGRIRNLMVEETRGKVVVSGEVRTWHSKQLALQAALELLSGDRFRERITVVGPGYSSR
ncbi:BON domain-containing protein [Paludisphaera mucosa]|uniref:BON domain-containing protein n=1 Tax=Paludisphaera mucosa TaxID=3030827 RepID=A0ABT6F8S9_9BACT|nr:BON domain-containing protein [Paludisphaera mucosa]MDG3003965.1 BON domain-containing protein [Paludisphaera mucosa]